MSALTQAQRYELAAMRRALDGYVVKIADDPTRINGNLPVLRAWRAGTADTPITYTQDADVRVFGDSPYLCCQTHTHRGEPDWTPDRAASLWREYHGTDAKTARPYRAPTGAHDIYKSGEYMFWTDGRIYRCLADTDRAPDVLPANWAAVT
ncbi:MAG: hypothetical protein RR296_06545 [Clostridia bacterium]